MNKKDEEIKTLKEFMSIIGYGENAYSYFDNESPDFDVVINGINIGIELTDYRLSATYASKILSVKSTMLDVDREVEQFYNLNSTRPLIINYQLRKPVKSTIKRLDKVALVNFLNNHLYHPDIEGKITDERFYCEFYYDYTVNKFIKKVDISCCLSGDKSIISKCNSFLYGQIPFKGIDKIVQTKNSKMDFKRNSQNWLLIKVPQEAHSAGIINQNVLRYRLSTHNFDRIFILEKFPIKVHEMEI